MSILTRASVKKHRAASPPYRHDIDGLRTVAVGLIVVYHVWFGRVSGGVDVFLMVSAFFLTGGLVRRAVDGVPIRLGAFWNRRFRTLLPAAAITILGVLALVFFLYPQTQWPQIWRESIASLLYVQNWGLAFSQVDYYARDAATSPLQHFWSLSVQGQVFILWPLVIGITTWVLRRRRDRVRPALIVVFSVVFASSLAFSIVTTYQNQEFAYFDTRARLWEFAAGSLLALVLPYVRLPALVRALIGWIGIAGVVLTGVVLDVQGGFPGYLALWPVLSTAAVIVSGTGENARWAPTRFLESKPLVALSKDSYALYLVHWPLLVTWMVVSERTSAGPFSGLLIILVSVVLARVLTAFVGAVSGRVAQPKISWRRGLAIIVASMLLVIVPTASWRTIEQWRAANAAAQTETAQPGDAGPAEGTVLPLGSQLDAEWVSYGTACSGAIAAADPALEGTCLANEAASAGAPTIVVLGDSHTQQLGAPLQALAEQEGFGIIALLKGGCTMGVDERARTADGSECGGWQEAALNYTRELNPVAVYTIVTRSEWGTQDRLLAGIERTVSTFESAGIPIIGVRDNPRFGVDMYGCATDPASDCAVARSEVLADANPAEELGDRLFTVDFTSSLCPGESCAAVVGNIAVYLDDNHTTKMFGRTLTEQLRQRLTETGILSALRGQREG